MKLSQTSIVDFIKPFCVLQTILLALFLHMLVKLKQLKENRLIFYVDGISYLFI